MHTTLLTFFICLFSSCHSVFGVVMTEMILSTVVATIDSHWAMIVDMACKIVLQGCLSFLDSRETAFWLEYLATKTVVIDTTPMS